MTQLMLFDAPATDSKFSFVAPAAASDLPPSNRNADHVRRQHDLDSHVHDPAPGGLQRMGDLAHAVIRRYEIVAERKARLLARGPRQAIRA